MTSTREKSLLLLAHGLVLASLLYPVWYVNIVPTTDFPGHLSRIYALSVLDTNPALAEMYETDWDYLPNITIDLFVLAAMKFVPLVAAGKLYISVSAALWMAGTAWLNRVLTERWSIVPLFAAPFVVNSCFFLGLMNFLAGAGLALVALAAWASMASWRTWTRLLCILPLTIAVYFTHLVGFVILACCMLGFELGLELAEPRISWRRGLRRLVLAAASLLPAVAIFIFLTPHQGHGQAWIFGDMTRVYTRVGHAAYLTYGRPYYLALALILLTGGVGLITRKIVIDRRMWPVLLGLGVGALIAPVSILGGAYVHIRLPPIIGCLGIASLKVNAGRLTKALFGCVLAGLLIYRANVMTKTWTPLDRDYAELAAAVDPIKPGSKIFFAQVLPKSTSGHRKLLMYLHYLDLIAVRRNLFTPLVMAWPAQHTLRSTEAYKSLAVSTSHYAILPNDRDLAPLASPEPDEITERIPYMARWQCKFDYLVNLQIDGGGNPAPAMLETWHTGTFFTIYKIVADRKDCG